MTLGLNKPSSIWKIESSRGNSCPQRVPGSCIATDKTNHDRLRTRIVPDLALVYTRSPGKRANARETRVACFRLIRLARRLVIIGSWSWLNNYASATSVYVTIQQRSLKRIRDPATWFLARFHNGIQISSAFETFGFNIVYMKQTNQREQRCNSRETRGANEGKTVVWLGVKWAFNRANRAFYAPYSFNQQKSFGFVQDVHAFYARSHLEAYLTRWSSKYPTSFQSKQLFRKSLKFLRFVLRILIK